MAKLQKELPDYLTYHCWQHTEHVIQMAEHIARHENLREEEILLIKTAALFHDFGFIEDAEDHEELSIQYCTQPLIEHGYSNAEIDIIAGQIRATKIPQQPQNELEDVLADADLEYLGTDLFIPIGNKLYQELKHYSPGLTKEEWNKVQVNFMKKHEYRTSFCIKNRMPKKLQNLAQLIENL